MMAVTTSAGSAVSSAAPVEGVGATSGARSTDAPQAYAAPDQAAATSVYVENAEPTYYSYAGPTYYAPQLRPENPVWSSPYGQMARFPMPGPFRIVAERESTQGFGFPADSYAQFIAISIVLASFGQIIESTGDRPKIATMMVSIGIAVLIWSTPTYFLPRFGVLNSWSMAGLLLIVLALVATYAWIIARIWNP